MIAPLLLDTCAAIWISENAALSDAAVAAIDHAFDTGVPIYVSPITAWEIGMLVSRRRFKLTLPPHRWFERLLRIEGFRLTDMSPGILVASSFLPGTFHRDPADRILAATAREYGYTLMTRDRTLLAYADEGHLHAIAC
jgi:PIN domain nuclease of toxin-antitoxin system